MMVLAMVTKARGRSLGIGVILVCLALVANWLVGQWRVVLRGQFLNCAVEEVAGEFEQWVAGRVALVRDLAASPATVDVLARLTQQANSQLAAKEFDDQVRKILPGTDFLDVYLFDRDGHAVYVQHKKQFLGHNFQSPRYQGLPLCTAYNLVRRTMTEDVSFINRHLSPGKLCVSACFPVLGKDGFVGVMAVEIDLTERNAAFSSVQRRGSSVEVLMGQVRFEELAYFYPPRLLPGLDLNEKGVIDSGLFDAARGGEGLQHYYDYRAQNVVAGSAYLPTLNAGLVIKQDVQEIVYWHEIAQYVLIGLGVLLCFLLLTGLRNFAWADLRLGAARLRQGIYGMPLMLLLSAMVGFAGLALLMNTISLRTLLKRLKETQHAEHGVTLQNMVMGFNATEQNMEGLARRITAALEQGVAKASLESLIEQGLQGALPDTIVMLASNGGAGLPPTVWLLAHGKLEARSLIARRDHHEVSSASALHAEWYLRAMKHGAAFVGALYDPTTSKNYNGAVRAFYAPGQRGSAAEPAGVVAVVHAFEDARKHIHAESPQSLRKLIIIDERGNFVFSEDDATVFSKPNIADLVHGPYFGRRDLTPGQLKVVLGDYLRQIDPDAYSRIVGEIRVPGWLCGVSFDMEQRLLPIGQLRCAGIETALLAMLLLIALVLYLFGLQGGFARGFLSRHFPKWLTLALLLGLAAVLLVIHRCSLLYEDRGPAMLCSSDTKKAIETISTARSLRSQDRIIIPTGLNVYDIDFTEKHGVTVSFYVWQVIPHEWWGKIEPGVGFVGAQKLTEFSSSYVTEKPHGKFVWWRYHVTLIHPKAYFTYPFHQELLQITMAPKDKKRGVLLVPDFATYAEVDKPYPWLDARLNLPGQFVKASYFTYQVRDYNDELGLASTTKFSLNLILKESLLGATVSFLIPLLLIFFAVFSFLWTSLADRLKVYSGLFFAVIMLHRALRDVLNIREVVYLEYFFFLAYISLLLLAITSVCLLLPRGGAEQKNEALERFDTYARRYYWPIQLTSWIAITVMAFYR